ncbi:MAG: 2-oxo acid dehydrogenase subunit E2 [Phototrophicales bacterium]|nr:MAG: 2-oxo acid dehydrogenase subunit E2 [Phototrophicales bacterium]
MATAVILPKFGFTLESSKIVRWLVSEGDRVREGDPLCEVETDKVNMEVEATADGVVAAIQYPAGADVPVTNVICYLLKPGESADAIPTPENAGAVAAEAAATPTPAQPSTSAAQKAANGVPVNASPLAIRIAEEHGIDLASVQGSGAGGKITRADVEALIAARGEQKIRATPAARRIAAQNAIELSAVTGTGPRGRIQGTDVATAVAQREAAQAESSAPLPAPAPQSDSGRRVIRLEGMRRTIAARMQQSFQQAPHTFFEADIDTVGIDALRARLKARNEKLSVTAIIVKACAWALKRHPYLNATLTGDEITLWSDCNIGVAVALENGLIVPVVQKVDRKSLQTIQTEIDDLAARARSNALRLNDLADGTFTVSNLGMYGIDRFTAIINPPQVAILAVGRAAKQFVPDENGSPVAKSLVSLTLSTDHRVVDGAQAAQFMADLRQVLEDPMLLLW